MQASTEISEEIQCVAGQGSSQVALERAVYEALRVKLKM
jgi:hypothetical protein